MEKLTALFVMSGALKYGLIALAIIWVIGSLMYLFYKLVLSSEYDRILSELKTMVKYCDKPQHKYAIDKKIQDIEAIKNKLHSGQIQELNKIKDDYNKKYVRTRPCYDPDQCFGRSCMDCEIKK